MIVGACVAVVIYVIVAPSRCLGRTCDGLVAFHYPPDSAGHWEAVGAAAVLGSAAALLMWLVIDSEGPAHTWAKIVATPLLIAGMATSLLSQSVLFILGPVIACLVLWFMWKPKKRPEPDRF